MPDADTRTGGVWGVHLLHTDVLGKRASQVTNRVGTFFAEEWMTPPIASQIDFAGQTIEMHERSRDDVCGSGM